MDVLIAGARLGPYEVLAPLGAGGMGHVYRATDTRLGRTVAIKVLSPELSSDVASRGRFEREARSIAALSHHHICTLHDVGDHDGQAFLVMELLEGQTLASRLAAVKRGLPVPEALSIATAVAEGLAFAHRHHIVHRDIKPANIMVTPTGVKLVDFGLARWRERDAGDANGPTQAALTEPHTVMGTLGYMSPEQLDGRADERSDVFAFGAVLFEMLTGRKTFTGDSSVKVMAAIVHEEPPPVSSLRPAVPAALDRVVQRCLAKDPDSRWQSMADLADEIRWIAREPAPAQPAMAATSGRWLTLVAIIATVVIAGLIGSRNFSSSLPDRLTRLSFNLPQGTILPDFGPGVAISPDGETIVYAAATGSGAARRDLFIKRLDSPDVKVVADSEGAAYPFFAPDGASVGFVTAAKLKKLNIQSGAVSVVADLSIVGSSGSGADASWGTDGSILIGEHGDLPPVGIRKISSMDGSVEELTRPNHALGEQTHFGAQHLPGVDTFLYSIRSNGKNGLEFRVVAQKGATPAQTIIPGASLAKYLGEGRLVYQVGTDLMIASFDPVTSAVTNPHRLTGGVSPTLSGAAWAIAGDTLVYRSHVTGSRRLTWVDRQGASTQLLVPARDYQGPSVSPNGEQIATTIRDGNRSDLWLIDLRQQTLTPITTDGVSGGGVWTANSTDYIARRVVGAAMEIFTTPVNGSGAARLLFRAEGSTAFAASLTPDRRTLVVMKPGDKTGPDLWTLDMTNPGTPALQPLVRTPANDYGGRVSPDGKWLAYFSDGSGRFELYVTAFSGGGPRWQISRDGAREAVWSKDGRELFYRNGNDFHVVAVTAGETFTWAPPRKLLSGPYYQTGGPGNVNYDVSHDGQRFLMIEEAAPAAPALNVVRGWPLLQQ